MAHVVGGLSLDDGRLFRSHLLECTSCRARVGELRAIAHDLADVERDERRERAARRTETKARESDETEVVAPVTNHLRTRTTLFIAAGLTVLMALSAWNFLLRGRLQETQTQAAQLRESASVLQSGQQWRTVATSTSSVAGQVRTGGDALVVIVEKLAYGADYWLYVYDAEGQQIHLSGAAADKGVIYEYRDGLPSADRVEIVRAPRPTRPPTGTTVFEARRGEDEVQPRADTEDGNAQIQPVGD
ncbi:hypothetical protein BH23ACT10_BH23ACT10_14200 [soil metagenome]